MEFKTTDNINLNQFTDGYTYNPGNIISLHLKNFQSYSNLFVTFHPNLNFIIGSNGSGKSSLSNAIALSLGGSDLNIEVDNICNFLPQERVSEFSKATPEELLEKIIEMSNLQKEFNELKALEIEHFRVKEDYRQEKLKIYHKDTFKAVKWLRNNRNLFEDEINVCKVELEVNPEKVTNWKLNILIRFRKSEEFKILEHSYHSGGEKSVSTMIFLLSLIEINNAPFRLVDEINQGMDAVNEKNIHNILVHLEHKSQFFIISPKLVEGLEYSENMKVLVIFNN
ncbi:uncharacterized protein, partial [Lepeophtheirus salmonis]|uniref:uncharacterized protein n=1 Tax=Lepeophtheirus salmonis TaxID=72036 RepID=UPI003AF37427